MQPSNTARSACPFLAFPWFLAFGAPNYDPTLTTLSSKIFHSLGPLPPVLLSIYLDLTHLALSVGKLWIIGLKSWASTQRWVDDGLACLVMFATEPRGKRLLLFVRSQAAVARPSGARPVHFFGGNPCEVNDQRSKLDSSNSSESIAMLVFTRDIVLAIMG